MFFHIQSYASGFLLEQTERKTRVFEKKKTCNTIPPNKSKFKTMVVTPIVNLRIDYVYNFSFSHQNDSEGKNKDMNLPPIINRLKILMREMLFIKTVGGGIGMQN